MNLKSRFGRVVSGIMAASLCVTMIPSVPALAASGDKFVVGNGTNQYKNVSDGYSYEVWIDNTGGTGSMTLGKGATFKAEWSAAVPQGNFLARRGLDFGSQKKATDYDYIGLDYEATYKQTNSGGNSRLCVYGWFENKNAAGNPPLVEYYIIEDWVNWCPSANGGASKTVTIDGAEYEIFAIDHTGPTIHGGSETFKQYFSVRKDSRTSGHITVSDHFKAWAEQGWGIGNLYEVSLNAEGWESSGVADVTMLDVYLDGDAPQPTTSPIPAESDGNFFKSTFESGADSWSGRGDATVKQDSKNYYEGKNSLFVSGRTDNWNGAAISLDTKTFIPGESYSFSTAALQKSGETTTMQLTLQYTLNGEDHYDKVASADAKSGEWTKLENTSFKIPSGARNLLLYVETPDSLTDFYIDNAQGQKGGTKSDVVNGGGTVEGAASSTTAQQQTTTKATTVAQPTGEIVYGDANGDGAVNIADATAIVQFIANPDKYPLSEQGLKNADCYEPGSGVTPMDAYAIQQLEARIITSLPVGNSQQPATTTAKTTTNKQDTTTTKAAQNNVDPTSYMNNVRKNITNNVPSSATASSSAGTIEDITYFSSTANRNKTAKVLLPAGYSKNEKYPVLYVNHGIFGDDSSMIGMGVADLAKNLMASGEAEKMIVVFTNMFSSNTMASPGGMDQSTFDGYDMFLDDLTKDLMPYIEKNYSIKTGRENTAISGFSMGGRESLYIGVSRPDLFGYIGAACPAPGVTPGVDSFATHPGNMSEADFRIKDTANYPYLWLITGGTNDTVVGTFPQKYHEILTTNGQDHIWQEIQGGGHDASCVTPMMYNFMKNIFKVSGGSSNTQPSTTTTVQNGGTVNVANNFDSSTGDWTGRGDASVKLDSDNYYSGKSLYVSGRTDNWNGAALALDSKTFVPGNAYSFSAAALQKSGSTTGISLTLQYNVGGDTKYANIASVDAKTNEWTKIENTSFTIPAGATDMILYFEAPDSLTDFYIDDVLIANEGTKSSVKTGGGTVKAGTTPVAQPSTGGVDISWIDPSKPMVAISFDDGAVGNAPTDTSMRIINALADSGFHSTFFYVGDWINNSNKEEEVKYAYSKGMEIANHTTSHPNLSEKSANEIRSEYDKCESKLKNIINAQPSKLLRLPYLASNNTVTSTLKDVPMITCSIDTGDWNGTSAYDMIDKIVKAKDNGSLDGAIVLAHETYDTTAEAIEFLAPYLKGEGYQIVTISEMFAVKGKSLDGGKIYTKVN